MYPLVFDVNRERACLPMDTPLNTGIRCTLAHTSRHDIDVDDVSCASCGTQLAAAAKFCSECGRPVASPTRTAEYKQVTVLFADVVHSMDLAANVGAEPLREIMTELVERSAAAIRRFDGTVDKFTGVRWRFVVSRSPRWQRFCFGGDLTPTYAKPRTKLSGWLRYQHPGFVLNEIQLLRMRALLAQAQGDDAAYRDFVDRYRAMAKSLAFEGHMAIAEAMR